MLSIFFSLFLLKFQFLLTESFNIELKIYLVK